MVESYALDDVGTPGEPVTSADVPANLVEAGAEQLAPVATTPWRHRNVRLNAPGPLQLTLFTVLDSDARRVERVEITRVSAHDAAE